MEFNNVEEKINHCQQRLTETQSQMGNHNHPSELFIVEKELQRELEKWSLVEESITKQK